MIYIGDKQLSFSGTFLLDQNEVALLEVDLASGEKMKFSLQFLNSPGESQASWSSEGGILKIIFTGWRNSIGTCFAKPVKIGDINGRSLGINVAQWLIGEMNVVVFQVYQGGAYA